MSIHADGKSGEGKSEGIVLAMDNGGLSMADRCGSVFFMQSGAQKTVVMAHRGKRVRQCVGVIDRDRAFQERQRFSCAFGHPGIDVRLSLEDKIISVKTFRPLAFDALNFGSKQRGLDSTDNRQRDLILKGENIVYLAVIALRPYMRAGCGINELSGDAHPSLYRPLPLR